MLRIGYLLEKQKSQIFRIRHGYYDENRFSLRETKEPDIEND
jgi:hypothetical protein